MYFVLKKYLRKENFKSEFIKYYSSYILNCLTKDITIFFKKIFYLITNKILKDNIEFFDDKKYFILQNIIVCGLDSLSNYEKEKLNKYIDNFKIKV